MSDLNEHPYSILINDALEGKYEIIAANLNKIEHQCDIHPIAEISFRVILENPKPRSGIKKVLFHKPATIVYWEDGTKTVVKCAKAEQWDKEKGLAMAIAKKAYGNTGKYCDFMKEWLSE